MLIIWYRKDITRPMPVVYEHIPAFREDEEKAETTKQKVLDFLQTSLAILVMTAFILCFAFGLSVEIVTMLGSILLVMVDTIMTQNGEVPKVLFRAIQWDVILVFAALFI